MNLQRYHKLHHAQRYYDAKLYFHFNYLIKCGLLLRACSERRPGFLWIFSLLALFYHIHGLPAPEYLAKLDF